MIILGSLSRHSDWCVDREIASKTVTSPQSLIVTLIALIELLIIANTTNMLNLDPYTASGIFSTSFDSCPNRIVASNDRFIEFVWGTGLREWNIHLTERKSMTVLCSSVGGLLVIHLPQFLA